MANGQSQGVADLGGLVDIFGALVGTSGSVETAGTGTTTGVTTERLKIDDAAIQKIIEDVLGGAQGLASIFGGEQVAGVFDSSVAARAAGDLASKLVGEIAKLTSERETRTRGTSTSEQQQTQEQQGLLEGIVSGTGSVLSDIGGSLGF